MVSPTTVEDLDGHAGLTFVDALQERLDDAIAATPRTDTDDGFIDSGWPGRIQPAARLALVVMQGRGRFSEDAEEQAPSR